MTCTTKSDRHIILHKILDKAGMSASFICAIHCAIMPLVLTILPLVGLSFFASEAMEWLLFASSATLGSISLCWGYKKHKSRAALKILACGLAFLALGRIGHEHNWNPYSVLLLVVGGLTVACSHVLNSRLCATCRLCSHTSTEGEIHES